MVTIFMVNEDIARGMVCFFHQKKHSYLIFLIKFLFRRRFREVEVDVERRAAGCVEERRLQVHLLVARLRAEQAEGALGHVRPEIPLTSFVFFFFFCGPPRLWKG
jgi:hypothetical protein